MSRVKFRYHAEKSGGYRQGNACQYNLPVNSRYVVDTDTFLMQYEADPESVCVTCLALVRRQQRRQYGKPSSV